MEIRTGLITGTGLYTLPGVNFVEQRTINTPFGGVGVDIGKLADQEVAFIPRHGKQHIIAPRDINYLGNIFAMKLLGVQRILATSVSGSLRASWQPGTLVIIDQFINFTHGRIDSYYPMHGKLYHVDVTDPYCKTLHNHLENAANKLNVIIQKGATYACLNGPRFETRAEIDMARRLGCDLIGHTNYPEVVLAREQAICYASIGVVSNLAAGMQDKVTAVEVSNNLRKIGPILGNLYSYLITNNPEPEDCICQHALEEAEL
jgi:5'-methylthioadenosine phosphorylase